tara:strand:- start:512 stop:1330 length:819 start_codon:yes stop_codon:yes gene_type:complete
MKKKMELKQLIGNNAYWTINKTLAKEYGLNSTLVLQHLIDLEENYFKGDFWQTSKSLQESLGLSKYLISESIKSLIKGDLISVENKVREGSRTISKVYHFTLLKSNISKVFNQCQSKDLTDDGKVFNKCQSKDLTDDGKEIQPLTVKKFDQVDKEKLNKEKPNKENILDVTSDADYYGKIFFKIVDNYPANRIGNRQHGLKKFKLLNKDNAKLAVINLKRYLDTASEPRFIKSLQNYIEEHCFSQKWLEAEETKNNKQNDTKTFNGTYDDLT